MRRAFRSIAFMTRAFPAARGGKTMRYEEVLARSGAPGSPAPGSGSADAIRKMRATAEEIHKDGSYLISKTLLVRRQGRWEKFD